MLTEDADIAGKNMEILLQVREDTDIEINVKRKSRAHVMTKLQDKNYNITTVINSFNTWMNSGTPCLKEIDYIFAKLKYRFFDKFFLKSTTLTQKLSHFSHHTPLINPCLLF